MGQCDKSHTVLRMGTNLPELPTVTAAALFPHLALLFTLLLRTSQNGSPVTQTYHHLLVELTLFLRRREGQTLLRSYHDCNSPPLSLLAIYRQKNGDPNVSPPRLRFFTSLFV